MTTISVLNDTYVSLPIVSAQGLVYHCGHLGYELELQLGKISFQILNDKNIYASFRCVCGREHMIVIK